MFVLIRFKNTRGGIDHYHRVHRDGSIDATPDPLNAARFPDEAAAEERIRSSCYLSTLDRGTIDFVSYDPN